MRYAGLKGIDYPWPKAVALIAVWHNEHYHSVILRALPPGCRRALDVGCGTGALTRKLGRLVPDVTGIDSDSRSVELASSHSDGGDVSYLLGDFLAFPFEPASFDLVTAVASLHHMDAVTALGRMRDLLRPGGVLVVVGLARNGSKLDYALHPVGALRDEIHKVGVAFLGRVRSGDRTPAETYQPPRVWPPAETYGEVRELTSRLLPGVRYRRRLLWRYSLVWVKPARSSL